MDDDGSKKVGVGVGLLAALGLGGARFADNCASVGARSVGAVDQVAMGSRGAARGTALDDAARVRGSAAIDDGARTRGGVIAHPDEADEVGRLGEVAGEAGFEVVSYAIDVDEPAPEDMPNAVHRPLVRDLALEASAWRRLIDGSDDISVAPKIWVGRAKGEALYVGRELVALTELADGCARVGASCVFVACDEDCKSVTDSLLRKGTEVDGLPLDSYVVEFAAARLDRTPVPMFIAIVDGSARELKLLRPRADRG